MQSIDLQLSYSNRLTLPTISRIEFCTLSGRHSTSSSSMRQSVLNDLLSYSIINKPPQDYCQEKRVIMNKQFCILVTSKGVCKTLHACTYSNCVHNTYHSWHHVPLFFFLMYAFWEKDKVLYNSCVSSLLEDQQLSAHFPLGRPLFSIAGGIFSSWKLEKE